MTTRQSIGPKLRFEVFKRDSFTCQYCGSKAPEVVLQVDHIHPVAEGGDADIMNLVTSCQTCNGGKGARLLSDASVVEKQRAQIEELEERRQQLEMMLQWRDGLRDLDEAQIDAVSRSVAERTNLQPNAAGRMDIRRWIKKYGVEEVIVAADESFIHHMQWGSDGRVTKDSWNVAFNKIGAFLTVRSAAKNKEILPRLLYIQGILRKRCNDRWMKCVAALETMHEQGVPIDLLTTIARESDSWGEFTSGVDGYLGYEEHVRSAAGGQ